MIIEIFADNLTKSDINSFTHRSSRAIVIKEDKILLLHAKKYDLYMLPGGGIEENETPDITVIRELGEETGYIGKVVKKTVIIKEYFPDETWESHYFIVEVGNEMTSKKLTEEEKLLDIDEVWMNVDEALTLLDTHYSKFIHGENILQREFIAIINSI